MPPECTRGIESQRFRLSCHSHLHRHCDGTATTADLTLATPQQRRSPTDAKAFLWVVSRLPRRDHFDSPGPGVIHFNQADPVDRLGRREAQRATMSRPPWPESTIRPQANPVRFRLT